MKRRALRTWTNKDGKVILRDFCIEKPMTKAASRRASKITILSFASRLRRKFKQLSNPTDGY